jgi:hypothetical protein
MLDAVFQGNRFANKLAPTKSLKPKIRKANTTTRFPGA